MWVANVGLILLIDESISIDILEFEIAGPYGGSARETFVAPELWLRRILYVLIILVDTGYLVAPELIERFTDITDADDVVPLPIAVDLNIACAREGNKLILVPRDVELAFPGEILGLDGTSIDSLPQDRYS